MATDTLTQSIAELTGKKPADLTPKIGPNLVVGWKNYLAEQGYTLERHDGRKELKDRHVVVYGDNAGNAQAVLSDSPEAPKVNALVRLTITKTKAAKAGDDKAA